MDTCEDCCWMKFNRDSDTDSCHCYYNPPVIVVAGSGVGMYAKTLRPMVMPADPACSKFKKVGENVYLTKSLKTSEE